MADHTEQSMRVPWRTIQGKVVMVTGASSGIGREVCLDLAGAGCAVIAAARRTDRLASLCEEINGGAIGQAKAVELDISVTGPMIEAAVQRAWEAFGRVDVLVNNAGIRGGVHSPLELSEEEWNNVMQTNLTGTWLVSKYIARRMRDTNIKGSIINISSIAGLNRGHWLGGIAYTASKSGVSTVSRVMALELGPYKIRVNSISPGLFKSEITEKLMQKAWLKNVATRGVPLRAFGTTHPALTSLLRYLIHDLSGYVTGNDFIVDSGITLPGVPIFSSL
ncbi:hypothetical protein QJS10_CPA10g00098 [Acorus calamus]|uniref:3-oxoacyl-[acyl-carrier-protein] reductase n=1 Tax=Acorus calamus TaxID=4465 RepID=A0AAV9E3C5_ACOCL|nr:hypothetical protein QJS10_CPA10g00098 [Acorus calamus]